MMFYYYDNDMTMIIMMVMMVMLVMMVMMQVLLDPKDLEKPGGLTPLASAVWCE